MEDGVTVTIRGLDELNAKLERQLPEVARKLLIKGVKAGGEIIHDEVAAEAHRLTGFLQDHIAMKVAVHQDGKGASAIIGPEAGVAYAVAPIHEGVAHVSKETLHYPEVYARFLEFGSKHQPATPFMGPALESSADAAIDAVANTIRAGLEELAK